MLQYLVLATPVIWAVVFFLIWQKRKHSSRLPGSRAKYDSSRSVFKTGAPKPPKPSKPAPVIELFSASASAQKTHPQEDHSE